jgi:alpha-acetolactate decarboxylase
MNNLDIGDLVKHPDWGLGTVIEIQVRVIFHEKENFGLDKTVQWYELTKDSDRKFKKKN